MQIQGDKNLYKLFLKRKGKKDTRLKEYRTEDPEVGLAQSSR